MLTIESCPRACRYWQLPCTHFLSGIALTPANWRRGVMASNAENVMTATPRQVTFASDGFVGGTSAAISTLESMLSEIAPTNIPVLLVGECGTGKQIFAHRIHQLSERSSEPLRKISCAAVTANAFAAELGLDETGHENEA